MNQPPSPPYTINLPTSDPNLTYDALMNTIHYLYTSSSLPRILPNHLKYSCLLYSRNLTSYPRRILPYHSPQFESHAAINSSFHLIFIILCTPLRPSNIPSRSLPTIHNRPFIKCHKLLYSYSTHTTSNFLSSTSALCKHRRLSSNSRSITI